MQLHDMLLLHTSAGGYISWEIDSHLYGGEKQACISGVNPPADIASGRIAEVRSRVCHAIA